MTVTSSYYKFSEAAILVFSQDNQDSFNSLSQHLLEVASFAENAKIFLVRNKIDLSQDLVSNEDVDSFW
jgi:Ras-related protein Rab-6A